MDNNQIYKFDILLKELKDLRYRMSTQKQITLIEATQVLERAKKIKSDLRCILDCVEEKLENNEINSEYKDYYIGYSNQNVEYCLEKEGINDEYTFNRSSLYIKDE